MNTNVSMKKWAGTSLIALSLAVAASAATINLHNTGVNGAGSPLPDGTIGDPHYSLYSVPGGTTTVRVRTASGGYPIPPYIGDNSTSAWIGPNNNSILSSPTGLYDYRTTFDLTGLIPSTASIFGLWATDDPGVDIKLNGVSISPLSAWMYSWTPFSITSGFLPGINTLDFIVYNDGGPTALRVEMHGDAQSAHATPDAGSTMLLLSGALTMIGSLRRKMV